jgi:hypothetical protein
MGGSRGTHKEVKCTQKFGDKTRRKETTLTFKNRASYKQDGRTATLQMLHFTYFFNNYTY